MQLRAPLSTPLTKCLRAIKSFWGRPSIITPPVSFITFIRPWSHKHAGPDTNYHTCQFYYHHYALGLKNTPAQTLITTPTSFIPLIRPWGHKHARPDTNYHTYQFYYPH